MISISSVAANLSNLSSTIPLTSLNAAPLDLRTHTNVRSPGNSPSPSTSPALQMIQEENNLDHLNRNPIRPQVSLTDEMGGEVTLIPCLSVSSCESNDSLEIRKYNMEDESMMVDSTQYSPVILPSFVISRPCDPSGPSIVRGIGKQSDRTNDNYSEFGRNEEDDSVMERLNKNILTSDERRESYAQTKNISLRRTFPLDYKTSHCKNIDFSDNDSISNDSIDIAQTFFKSEQNSNDFAHACSSNLYSGCSISTGDIFASELVEKTSSGSFEVRLSEYYSELKANDILTIVKKIIDVKAPPKCCFLSSSEDLSANDEENGLSLEYPGGVQIELKVCEKSGCEQKGLKLRRISGDQIQYSQLCHQLISCMIV